MKKEPTTEATHHVSLIGGLGNQLFQLAYVLSLPSNNKPILVSGLSHTRKNQDGKPEILSFSAEAHARHIEKSPTRLFIRVHNILIRFSVESEPSRLVTSIVKFCSSILSILTRKNFGRRIRVAVAKGIDDSELSLQSGASLNLGYFQTSRIIENEYVLEKMKSLEIKSPSPALLELRNLSQSENPLVVHVRLGDYKNEENIGLLNINYYQSALSQIWDDKKFHKIWVFSDEIDLAHHYIPLQYQKHVRWIESVDNSPSLTFEAMRYGQGYVLANSTYSWWAAILSYSSRPTVMCPTPWYQGKNSPKTIFSKNWHTIPRS